METAEQYRPDSCSQTPELAVLSAAAVDWAAAEIPPVAGAVVEAAVGVAAGAVAGAVAGVEFPAVVVRPDDSQTVAALEAEVSALPAVEDWDFPVAPVAAAESRSRVGLGC